jgi:hypothetical protein
MRARDAHTCRHSLSRGHGCRYGRAEGRFGTCIHIYIHVCECVCVFDAYTYIIHSSVYVRIGRRYVCVSQCAMVMDRLCARVGGLVLRARPKPETLNLATSCCLSASTACGFGAQAFNSASAFNANIGAWNTARVTSLSSVCAAPGPAARTMADALGRASMRRPTMGVGTTARRGGSVHVSEYIHICVCVCVLHAN